MIERRGSGKIPRIPKYRADLFASVASEMGNEVFPDGKLRGVVAGFSGIEDYHERTRRTSESVLFWRNEGLIMKTGGGWAFTEKGVKVAKKIEKGILEEEAAELFSQPELLDPDDSHRFLTFSSGSRKIIRPVGESDGEKSSDNDPGWDNAISIWED